MAQWDLANADCIVVMGSNMAENHPIAFRFVLQAKEGRDGHPRRPALHAHLGAGRHLRADPGGFRHRVPRRMIRYILENDLWFKEYALDYTNISTIIEDESGTPERATACSRAGTRTKPATTRYLAVRGQGGAGDPRRALRQHRPEQRERRRWPSARRRRTARCSTRVRLPDPEAALRRYTPEMVERVTGCPRETFLKVADAIARNSGRERTGAFCYAVGWTHHTTGVQMIRAAAMIQALLGNVGRPGGGIMALRGHSSIQGSTDIPTLYNMLPGYLPQPSARKPHKTLKEYLEDEAAADRLVAQLPEVRGQPAARPGTATPRPWRMIC